MFITCHGINIIQGSLSTDMLVGASRHRLLKPLTMGYALSYNESPI
jgi:hypothetical protein